MENERNNAISERNKEIIGMQSSGTSYDGGSVGSSNNIFRSSSN